MLIADYSSLKQLAVANNRKHQGTAQLSVKKAYISYHQVNNSYNSLLQFTATNNCY
jgi:hypothetical protein